MAKAITHAMVFDYEDFYEDGYVVFDDKVIDKGPMEKFKDEGYDIIDGRGHLVMPSFIIGHTHIYSTFARGWINPFEYRNFMDILKEQWWKLDSGLRRESIYYSGIVNAADHVKNGVTTLIDHHASGEIEDSLDTLEKAVSEDIGLRGMFTFETSDRFDVEKCLQENAAFLKKGRTARRAGHFGLHASLSLSEETLKRVREAKGDAPIHIHAAESAMDQADAEERTGERVIERLDRHGLLTPGSILVHALHINDAERDIIKKRGAVVALNPSSNMNNGVGIPDYPALRNKGIPVIVGNDGLSFSATSEYRTLFFASHALKEDFTAMGLEDIQRIIDDTYAYASEHLGVRLGRFRKGYEADLLMLPYTPPTPISLDNALGHLFFGTFDSFKPSDVFVGGRHIVRNYTLDADNESRYRDARAHAQHVWDTLNRKGETE